MTTKKDRNDIDQKLIDAAYGATSGAAFGATVVVLADTIASGLVISSAAYSIIPVVGTVVGGVAGLAIGIGVLGINQKPKNISDENKTEH